MADLLEQYHSARLKIEREKTLLRLTHLREALKFEVGSLTDRKDPPLKEHEMVLTQIQILERELQWLDDALQQAKQGRYGRCIRCGELIDPARLEVLPETTLCFACKTILERQPHIQTIMA